MYSILKWYFKYERNSKIVMSDALIYTHYDPGVSVINVCRPKQ